MDVSQEMAKMERAAHILMGENSELAQRREAEAYFVQLKEANLDPNVCRMVLETTAEPVVMFQITQCLCSSVVKNWGVSPKENLLEICKYLLELPLKREGLPGYVIAEVLKAGATLIKRGIVGADAWDMGFVLDFVSKLLENPDERIQSLGLRVVEAISIEFSTMWRSTTAMGFDFHHKAKKKFEETLLKQFMQMSLNALSRVISSPESVNETVCDRFLKVAVIVLQWNFTTSIKTAFLKVNLYSMNSTVALRPPPSWSDLFTNDDLLPFFFGLHKKVRHTQQLAENSLACIAQLAAVMGSCLEPRVREPRSSGVVQPHDLYVQRYCSNMMDCFHDCFPYEVLPFTTGLHRIFSHHPTPIFKRFPVDLASNFIKFVVHWSVQLAQPAMVERKDDESVLVEAYTHVLTCWASLMRSAPTFPKEIQEVINSENNQVIESFLRAILAPPFGSRVSVEQDPAEDEDDELDDTQYYSVILNNIGCFCRLSITSFTSFIINSLNERINQRQLISQAGVSEADRVLWLEDMHWILLLTGSFFQDADRDICAWLDKGYKERKFVLVDMPNLILKSMSSEEFDVPANADPITIIVGLVCQWFGIVLRSLESAGAESRIVSPELYRTTFLSFSVIVNFLTNLMDESPAQFFDDAPSASMSLMPVLPSQGEFAVRLIDVVVRHVFMAFKIFPSEKKLCNSAVGLLLQESEKRAEVIAKCPLLYELISTITLERLPARRNFMTCLVTIGSNVNSTREREQMHDMILKPMAARFMEAAQHYLSGNFQVGPHIVDLLECFSGIARAAQIESGSILYEYLLPILRVCSQLMRIAVDAQGLVDAILDVFHRVATTVFVFLDIKTNGSEEESSFFQLLMELFDNYKESQLKRFNRAGAFAELEQEEQISDLVQLLKIISNSISKPYIIYAAPNNISDHLSTPLCRKTLEMMLPLMGDDCLQLPTLSTAFFRLLLNICEACPTVFLELDEPAVSRLFYCFGWALSGVASTEPTRLNLECLAMISKMLSNSTDSANGPFAVKMFKELVAKTFEMAVHSSAEVEIHVSAIKAVFGFIGLNREFFMEYVQAVVARPENAARHELAVKAFLDLVPQSENLNSRQEYKAFSDRFEKFLELADNLVI